MERRGKEVGNEKTSESPSHHNPHSHHTIAKIGDQRFTRLTYLVPRCTPPQAVCPRSACWGEAGPT